MADELAVRGSKVDAFIVRIVNRGDGSLTRAEIEDAAQLYRGCGILRRYIALVICRMYPEVETLHEREVFNRECFIHLRSDPAYVRRQAKLAEMEIELFGPLTSDPDRFKKNLTFAERDLLAKLPDADARRAAYEECVTLHTDHLGVFAMSKRWLIDMEHIRNRLMKGISPPPAEDNVPVGAVVDTRTGRQVKEQEYIPPPPTPPAPRTRPTVSSFTHPPDPDPEEEPSVTYAPPATQVDAQRLDNLECLFIVARVLRDALRDALRGANDQAITVTAERKMALDAFFKAVADCEE